MLSYFRFLKMHIKVMKTIEHKITSPHQRFAVTDNHSGMKSITVLGLPSDSTPPTQSASLPSTNSIERVAVVMLMIATCTGHVSTVLY